MTEAEQILWQKLRNNQFHGLHFRRQQIIDGFIVDFYCKAALLVIELDGEIHEKQIEYDTERDEVISSRGLKILRIKNEEIRDNLERVLLKIAEVCSLQVQNK
jgi:very-short-patch-repair endonuclease